MKLLKTYEFKNKKIHRVQDLNHRCIKGNSNG